MTTKLRTLSKAIYESSLPVALYRAKEVLPKARLGVEYLVKLHKGREKFLCPVSSRRARELFPALLEKASRRGGITHEVFRRVNLGL